jgi:hypothetical protein
MRKPLELLPDLNDAGAQVLWCNGYMLFTFYQDGSTFAHALIDAEKTGLDVTRKSNLVKLVK